MITIKYSSPFFGTVGIANAIGGLKSYIITHQPVKAPTGVEATEFKGGTGFCKPGNGPSSGVKIGGVGGENATETKANGPGRDHKAIAEGETVFEAAQLNPVIGVSLKGQQGHVRIKAGGSGKATIGEIGGLKLKA